MINSEYFGMTFWLDDDNQLMYCPTLINKKPDKSCSGYVCDWDDWEGVNYRVLFNIHQACVINKINHNNSLTLGGVNS